MPAERTATTNEEGEGHWWRRKAGPAYRDCERVRADGAVRGGGLRTGAGGRARSVLLRLGLQRRRLRVGHERRHGYALQCVAPSRSFGLVAAGSRPTVPGAGDGGGGAPGRRRALVCALNTLNEGGEGMVGGEGPGSRPLTARPVLGSASRLTRGWYRGGGRAVFSDAPGPCACFHGPYGAGCGSCAAACHPSGTKCA